MSRGKYSKEFLDGLVSGMLPAVLEHSGIFSKVAGSFGLRRNQLAGILSNHASVDAAYREAMEELYDSIEEKVFEAGRSDSRFSNANAAIKVLQAVRGERWNPARRVEIEETGYRAPTDDDKREVGRNRALTVIQGGDS